MPLKKLQDYILESLLPTKLTILIAGSTISITLLSIGLPNFLQTLGIQLSVEKTLLLRIVSPLSILCLGTFVVLLLVLHHYKRLKISQCQQLTLQPLQSKKAEGKITLTEMHEKILELLFQKPANVEDVCKTFKLNREESNYYLYDLNNKEMAYPPVAYSSGRHEWQISQEGREHIMVKRNSDQKKEK